MGAAAPGTAPGGFGLAGGDRAGVFRFCGSGGAQDFPEGVALPCGVVPLRLRLVLEPPAQADDGDGGVGQAGQVAGQFAAAHPGAVLVPGPVAGVMEPVFDLPVPPVQGEDFRGAGAFGAERGEAVHGFFGGGVFLQDGAAAADAERLPSSRQGGEVVWMRVQWHEPAAALLEAAVPLVAGFGGGRGVEGGVEGRDVPPQGFAVALDGQHVVRALADDQPRGFRAAVQGVERQHAARDVQLPDQAAGAGDLPARAVRGGLAGDDAGPVRDRGRQHAPVVRPARAVQRGGLAVDGQRALRGQAVGREPPHRPVERVRVDARQQAVHARPRRRREAAGGRAAERPRRRQLPLVQARAELGDGGRPLGAGQLGRRRDGQHGRQRMPHAAGAAELRHLAQVVEQAAQPAGRRQLRLRPGAAPVRGFGQAGQVRSRVRRQRPQPHRLRLPVSHPAAAGAGVAARRADLLPPGGAVGQVRRPAAGQHQEAAVVRDQTQAPELLLRRPADPGVPRLDLERAGAPAEQRQPLAVRPRRHMADPVAEHAPEPKIVPGVHDTVPPGLFDRVGNGAHRDRGQGEAQG